MKEETIQKIITELFITMEIPVETKITLENDNVTWWVDISSKDGHLFLGHNGEGLMALSHVVKEIVRKDLVDKDARPPVIIDINGFQKKHVDNLKTVAHMMGERARFFKSSISLDPMSPYDRRIVHEYFTNAKDLKTESEGIGRDRHVVIKYFEPVESGF